MKNTICLLICLLLLFSSSGCRRDKARNLTQENSLTVLCTPELFSLTTEWADEFCSINPDVTINVINITESSIAESLDNSSNLAFISGDYDMATFGETQWKIVIGHDVIVPIFNSGNPLMDEISLKGISLEKFDQVINSQETRNWGAILNIDRNFPATLYIMDDASINQGIGNLLGKELVAIDAIRLDEAEDLIKAVSNDPYAIGICKIAEVIDIENQSFLENIKLLPIDRNGNGKIDYMENIYDDLSVLSRSLSIGKYPGALTNKIYSVSSIKPTGKNEVAFLKWTLTDGQQALNNNGFSELNVNDRIAKARQMEDYGIITSPTANYAIAKEPLFFYIYFPIILTLVLGIIFSATTGILFRRNKSVSIPGIGSMPRLLFDENFIESPEGLFYDKTHTWAFMEEDGLVKVGIDDFLQHVTGPLTRVKMKSAGEKVKKGKHILSIIQDGKQLDINAPISGTIREFNGLLNKDTSVINSSPYNAGWIYKIEPTKWLKENQYLIMGNKYKEWLKDEFSRLKEFLTIYLRPETAKYAYVLQDGGELKDGILIDFGPEVWEDFQANFIDFPS